jgi:hypothetical protein
MNGHRSGGKMFQRQGKILKRGVKVRLGQMARVARFRKKAEVSELQLLDQAGFFADHDRILIRSPQGVDKKHGKKENVQGKVDEKVC